MTDGAFLNEQETCIQEIEMRCLLSDKADVESSHGTYMTHEELIIVARSHTVDFPKLTGEPWANQETLTKTTVLDTVIVSFESDQHPKRIMILLEKDSGKFIASWLASRAEPTAGRL